MAKQQEPPDDDMVRIVDATFRLLAQQQSDVPIEAAVDGAWSLFERGCLRLAQDGDHVRVEQCENRAERRAQARQNRPLAEFRRRRKAGHHQLVADSREHIRETRDRRW